MYTLFEIYLKFRQAQSKFFSRPYRLPKNFDEFINKRLSRQNKESLEIVTNFFNTKWKNISIDRYFQYGFEIYDSKFTYVRFFDKIVMNGYIARDKHLKRDIEINKQNLINSARFIKKFIKNNIVNNKISRIIQYSRMRDKKDSLPIIHYIRGKIDKYFLVWLIKRKYLILNDNDRSLLPLIVENYRDYLNDLDSFKNLMIKIEDRI